MHLGLTVCKTEEVCFITEKNPSKGILTEEFPDSVAFTLINMNSLRNKFELLKPFIYNAFDIYLVSETKIDSSFPNSPFSLAGYLDDMIEIALKEAYACMSMKAFL